MHDLEKRWCKPDFLKKGTLVEVVGTPFAKGYLQDDQSIKTEIRLNVSKTNILRPAKDDDRLSFDYDEIENEVENSYAIEDATAKVLEELEEDLF